MAEPEEKYVDKFMQKRFEDPQEAKAYAAQWKLDTPDVYFPSAFAMELNGEIIVIAKRANSC